MSLRDTSTQEAKDTTGPNSSSGQQPISEEYSTIVTRVPNRSVEDLSLEVSQAERTTQVNYTGRQAERTTQVNYMGMSGRTDNTGKLYRKYRQSRQHR